MLDIYGKINITLMCDSCLKQISTERNSSDLIYQSLESHIEDIIEQYSFEDESICSECWNSED